METNTDTDICIVGCGPVGAFSSIALRARGFEVIVVEKQADIYHLPRAINLDDELRRAFQNLDMEMHIADMVTPLQGAEFLDANLERLFGIDMPPGFIGPNGHPPASAFHQPDLDTLLRTVARERGADIRLRTEVVGVTEQADAVRVDTPGGAITARWVVACDGASSAVRRMLGVGIEDRGFDQDWLVVDIDLTQLDHPMPSCAQQVCDPDRPATFVPGHANHRRWEFQIQPGEDPRAMCAPDTVWSLVAPWITPVQGNLIRAVVYRFHAMVAETMRVGRVFLAGDAAHQMPPFLGQGLNTGFRDAVNLAWKMDLVARRVAGDALLDTYEMERKPHASGVVEHAVDVGRLIDTLAGRADHDVDQSSGYGGGRPFPRLEQGVLWGGGDRVGRLQPQPTVDGVPLDAHLGDGFAVLVADPSIEVPPAWTGLGARVVSVEPELIGGHGLAIVRPDRYVAATVDDQAAADRATASLLDALAVGPA